MTKRIVLNVPDSLHSRLKEEAAREGVSMNALCVSYLSDPEDTEGNYEDALFDPVLYQTLPLNFLRDELTKVARSDLEAYDKRQRMLKLQNEMANRYRL